MAEKAAAPKKNEAPERPVTRRESWFDLPELFRWDLPDFFRTNFPERLRWFEGSPETRVAPIRVEEEMDGDNLVIRAELPGIDPEKDVEITVSDHALHIRAERRTKTKDESEGRVRSEFQYGSYSRTIPLPKGYSEKDVAATYHDGILEVTVPVKAPSAEKRKVEVTRGG